MRKKRKTSEPTFIEYNQEQPFLIPPSIDEMVPQNHLVRIVNSIIEKMDLKSLLKRYKGGGRSSYHPKMMLKVMVYAYTQQIYSSRKIAKALRENIHFMWLSGMNRPDFRTINRFRVSRLRRSIDEVFYSVIAILEEMNLIQLDNYFLDGTKIEANANRYTWVWSKSTKRYKANLLKKVQALLIEINDVNDAEYEKYKDKDLEEMGEDATIDSEKLDEIVKELDERLAEDNDNNDLKRAVKTIKQDYLPRLKKYEDQEKKAGDRNSYSKTDVDATFMRMKEDHMKNGQLKPAYNIQMGTENQFIVGYSIHQKTTDTSCLKPHFEHIKKNLHQNPERVIADSGYGSEENYVYLEKEKIDAYVKFNYFHMEQRRKFKKDVYRKENLSYDEKTDTYTCPADKKLSFSHTKTRETDAGYNSQVHVYEAEDCTGCGHREQCHKSKYNRRLYIRPLLEYHKERMRSKLKSPVGLQLRSKRPVEVESVFGQIKWNRGFKRFLLRGLDKVKIEWGLLSIAHNLMKIPV